MRFAWLLALLTLASGCKTRLLTLPVDGGFDQGIDLAGFDMPPPPPPRLIATCRQGIPNTKVDLLFLVDNSGSMDGMQLELRKRFPEFFQIFKDLAAKGTNVDLHIGVITSDYGAGSTSTPGCDLSPGGQRGILQAVGAEAPLTCKAPVGDRFVRFVFGGGNNLPTGQTLEDTFTCMASVGAKGCGAEHVLEATYAALHNTNENRGFLRDDALLAIVFLTNEDDCSAPADTDLFDPAKTDQYGPDNSFRCTKWGVVCGNPPAAPPWADSMGPLPFCAPAPNPNGQGPGKLFDVSRYSDFFYRPKVQGGVKGNPFDVMIVGLHAPPEPFATVIANDEDQDHNYVQCAQIGSTCVPVLQRSCHNKLQTVFYGDPAVRLNSVIRQSPNWGYSSICDGDYSGAFDTLSNLMKADFGQCCMPMVLPMDPVCTVEQVVQAGDGSMSSTPIARCDGSGATPCWRAVMKKECDGLSPQGIGIEIDRGGQPPPVNSTIRASCDPQM
jgi:hypothetical protein